MVMPHIEYWFSGAAVYLAGSFAFAIFVGMIGIKEMVSRRLFTALMGVAVVLTALAWRTAAKQEQDNSELTQSITTIAGALKAAPASSAKELADEIMKLLPPKYPLTDAEKERLGSVLNSTPSGQRFSVELFWPQLNGTRGYADTLALVFRAAGWDVTVRMAALTNGHGLTFALSSKTDLGKDAAPADAIRLMELLSKAQVPFAVGQLENVPPGTFAFVVGEPGNAPKITP
jgi:hypothetical protein